MLGFPRCRAALFIVAVVVGSILLLTQGWQRHRREFGETKPRQAASNRDCNEETLRRKRINSFSEVPFVDIQFLESVLRLGLILTSALDQT